MNPTYLSLPAQRLARTLARWPNERLEAALADGDLGQAGDESGQAWCEALQYEHRRRGPQAD